MKKRSNGEGSIVYEKDRNAYRAYIVAPDGRRVSKRFKTESDAIAWKIEQLSAIQKGAYIAPSTITLGEWAIEWLLMFKKGNVAQSTYEHYFYLATHLNFIANVKLQELTAVNIQQLYKYLTETTPLSEHTIHKVHKFLKGAIGKAYQLGMLRKNIMLNVSTPKYEKQDIEIFSQIEVEKILKTCYEHPVLKKRYPPLVLIATTGIRLGEALGLRWCDVNLTANEIQLKKSLEQTKTLGLVLGPLKTKASARKIKLTPEVVDTLKKLKSETINIDIKQKKLCFVTRNETPIGPRTFERSWSDILRIANVSYRKLHVLRHTHATELLAAGVPIIEVSRRLGHSRISHTLELYGHSIPNYEDKIADKVQKLYSVPK